MHPHIEPENTGWITDIREGRASDGAILKTIEIKCHEFYPYSQKELMELFRDEAVHFTVAVQNYIDVGFIAWEMREGKLYIHRLSVLPDFVNRGVPEKLVEVMRVTILAQPPMLRMVVTENDIGTPLFVKLTKDIGFQGVGIVPQLFHQFGKDCDGIRLELK